MRGRWLFFGVLWVALVGCSSAPRARVASAVQEGDLEGALAAYERFRRTEGADHDLLARMAALVLEREARAADETARRAAITQLALAGTAGEPVLLRLSESDGLTPARLAALEALARRDHLPSRLALRSFADSDDPRVVAASIIGMDPERDRALLLSLTRSEDARVRREAFRMLARAADAPEVAEALAEAARVDADPSVRAAAVRGLGRSGAEALPMLRERLSDPSVSVRLAAIGALANAPGGRAILATMLEIRPSSAGVEAARLIMVEGTPSDPLSQRARAFLRAALASEDAALRSQAGVAFASLPEAREPPLAVLRDALAAEADPDVQLALARALWPDDSARSALEALLDADAMPRVQAAALLASTGHADARAVLAGVLAGDGSSILRRTAARALARDAMAPDAARRALLDDDPLVRIYAAGGILAAAVAT